MTSTIDSYVESNRKRVNEHRHLVDQHGRNKISKSLQDGSKNPYQSIAEIQSTWSLNFPRTSPALSFLDILQCSRSSVYQNLLENLKGRLENQLNTMTDESKLHIMLTETIPYMNSKDLKQIPISIIKRLSTIPEKFLNFLATKGFLMDVPLAVRRSAWEINIPLFTTAIDSHCRSFILLLGTKGGNTNRSEGPMKTLCDYIGKNELLFSAFADYCTLKAREESCPSWGSVLRGVLMSLQETGEKIGTLGKLHDLAWLLDHCKRQGKIDTKNILAIVEMLRFFIIAQYTKQESLFKKEFEVSSEARKVYYNKNVDEKSSINSSSSSSVKNKAAVLIRSSVRENENSKRIIKSSSVIDTKEPVDIYREAWRFLSKLDDGTFASRVLEIHAPGYNQQIKKPMDLSRNITKT